jgi:hypothetical protein
MPPPANGASVTDVPCKCGLMGYYAGNPSIPIVFDEEMGEFRITDKADGYILLWHCPFCGGVTPKSNRSSFFAMVSPGEEERLLALTKGLTTIDEVRAAFGPPDDDTRTLRYSKLSEIADLRLITEGDGSVRFSVSAKRLGKPKG